MDPVFFEFLQARKDFLAYSLRRANFCPQLLHFIEQNRID